MNIYQNNKIVELNNIDLYKEGIESVEKALSISKNIDTKIKEKYDIFVYWIGDNVNYKHSTVIKSFLSTQDLEYARLRIYSDKDISNKDYFREYKKFEQVEFNIFDIEKEIVGTEFENFKYCNEIKNHLFNPAYESDFFRILMLHKFGGFYIDFDVLLLRDLSPLLNYDFLYQWGCFPNNMINGAVMHLKKNSEVNKTLTNLLKDRNARPGLGSLYWASDLYLEAKQKSDDLVIFPAAFFNSEWQSTLVVNGLLDPLKKHQYSNYLYDGCFTWHWHNRWEEQIEAGSKFDILDKILEEKYKKKFFN